MKPQDRTVEACRARFDNSHLCVVREPSKEERRAEMVRTLKMAGIVFIVVAIFSVAAVLGLISYVDGFEPMVERFH